DKEGRHFIDRNPTHFAAILDFLRDPIAGMYWSLEAPPHITKLLTSIGPELPSSLKEREEFLREVDYFGLKEVMVGEKKEAKELCEQGYAFYNGKGVPKDPKKAVALWQRAAELGMHFQRMFLI